MRLVVTRLLLAACCLCCGLGQRRPVGRLPRLTFEPQFGQYSGYLHAAAGRRLFYWLVEAAEAPAAEAPLLLWLNGGPGCSSVGGLLMTSGPFLADAAARLVRNRWAWNRVANVLYIDSPVGTGLSEPGSFNASVLNDDVTIETLLLALRRFYKIFPEFVGRRLLLAGESYAGVYIPLLAAEVLRSADYPDVLNLTDVAIGNGLFVPIQDQRLADARVQFGAVLGLSFNESSSERNLSINSYNCARPCHHQASRNVYPCLNSTGLVAYLNDAEVRAALGVLSSVPDYVICQHEQVFARYASVQRDMVPQLQLLARSRVRTMLFHGHLDYLIPVSVTQLVLRRLAAAVPQDELQQDFWQYCSRDYGLQVGGLHESFGNGQLLFRTVIGAGHSVATDLPEAGYQILSDLLLPAGGNFSCEQRPPSSGAAFSAQPLRLLPLLPLLLLLLAG